MLPNIKATNLLALLLIFSIFLVKYVGTYYLFHNNLSLFVDEAQYWLWSKELAFGYYSKPPLIALIIKIFAYFFGDTEVILKSISNFCVAITAWFVFKLTCQLHSKALGITALIVFSFMPITIYGSFFLATDLPLIMFWSMALYVLYLALQNHNRKYWLLLGVLIGLGILTKYAFVYFYLCLFVYLVIFARSDFTLSKNNILLSLIVTIVVISPNIYWSIQNDFITFKHIANDNIEVNNKLYSPLNSLKFFTEQIGVFGILNFYIICLGFYKKLYKEKKQQFLLCFCLPIFILVFSQAIINNANSNWAALAFVSLSIYTAIIIQILNLGKFFKCSTILNSLTFLIFIFAGDISSFFSLSKNPYDKIDGWRQIANFVRTNHCDKKQIYLFRDRKMAAEMSYYLQGCYTKIEYYTDEKNIKNYYHMIHPFTKEEDYLYIVSNTNSLLPLNYRQVKVASYEVVISPNKNLQILVKKLAKN